jgi:mycothiol synthase
MRLREFTLRDIAAIADIRNASVSISPDFYAMTVDRFRCDFYGEGQPAQSRIIVAENEQLEVVGFYHLYTDEHLLRTGRADLDSLHVRPDIRSAGIGALLLTHACTAAGEWGARHVSIAIPESSTRSLAFLNRHGFEAVCTFEKTRVKLSGTEFASPVLPPEQGLRHFEVGVDESAFIKLFNACFSKLWNFSELTIKELTDWNHRANFDPEGCFLLFENDVLIGFSTVLKTEETIENSPAPIGRIFELGVIPHKRRSGAGFVLLQKALHYAAMQGLHAVDLVTEASHDGGRHLFQKLGEHPIRRTIVLHRQIDAMQDSKRIVDG